MHTNVDFMLFVIILIGVVVLVPVWGVTRYLSWFSNYEPPQVDNAQLPCAAVILAVRGAAPSLEECLCRLVNQAYPSYQVHVVVDHPTDPACKIIHDWCSVHPNASLQVTFLENPSTNAYLKTSSVMQCIGKLPGDVGAVVLVDADTLVYPTWLADLVQPLLNEEIGLVTGNRWYDPTCRSWGALIRFFYNALCVPPMYFMKATWGGSLAIKRVVFATDFFRESLADHYSEEVIFQSATSNEGLRFEIQPDVMILNRETSTLRAAFSFMKRQLLWTRLYHPSWSRLLAGTCAVYLFFSGLLLVGIYALAIGKILHACMLLGGTLLEIVTCQILAEWLHRSIARRAQRVQGTDFPQIDWPSRCRMVVVLPIAFIVYSYAMLAATIARRVTWSGITYEVIPPGSIHMVKYHPIIEVNETE